MLNNDGRVISGSSLVVRSLFDVVLFQDVVQHRIEVFLDVFDEQGAAEGQSIFNMVTEILVIQSCYLGYGSINHSI